MATAEGAMSLDDTLIKAFHAHRAAGDLFHGGAGAAHEIFQTSTINAVLESVYDGDTTFAELARHGDLGLGTFNALDGEMTALDGAFFQARSDGRLYPVAPEMKTPFAVMIPFDPTLSVEIAEPTDLDSLLKALDKAVPSKNLFYAVRVDGHFSHVRVRAVPRQEKPYPPLVAVAAHQPEFEHRDIEGSLVGFRFPDYTAGINVPGYHVHFVSADRSVGGHVLAFEMAHGRVAVDVTSQFHMDLPEESAFLQADLAKDSAADIEKAEK
jgi:acetolactate decarboxylase